MMAATVASVTLSHAKGSLAGVAVRHVSAPGFKSADHHSGPRTAQARSCGGSRHF